MGFITMKKAHHLGTMFYFLQLPEVNYLGIPGFKLMGMFHTSIILRMILEVSFKSTNDLIVGLGPGV